MIRESNQLHALCLDTRPPLLYLTHDTVRLIHQIEALNKEEGQLVAAYTVDAGANVFVLTLEEYSPKLRNLLYDYKHKYVCGVGEGTREVSAHQLMMISVRFD